MKIPNIFALLFRLSIILALLTGLSQPVLSADASFLSSLTFDPPTNNDGAPQDSDSLDPENHPAPEPRDLMEDIDLIEQAKLEGSEALTALLDIMEGEALALVQQELTRMLEQPARQVLEPEMDPAGPNAIPLDVGSGCTYPTIQAAIDVASPGNTIRVEGGVSFAEELEINKDLTIIGGYPGCASGSSARTTIDGFTLSGDSLVDVTNNSSVTLRDLRIVDGSGASMGGGIYQDSGTVVVLDYVDILGNSANFGGGVYIMPTAVMTATNDSWIASNSAVSVGGGVRVLGSFYAQERSDIDDNYASDGGGIAASSALIDLDDSWVRYNQTTGGDGMGGGIYAIGGSTVDLQNSASVSNNVAFNGGGIYADGSTINVQIGFFHTNTASNYGGGVHLTNNASLLGGSFRIGGEDAVLGNMADQGAGVYAITSTINLSGGQIYANIAEDKGAGIYADNTTLDLTRANVGKPTGDRPNKLGVDGNEGVGLYLTNNTTATLDETEVSGNAFQTTGNTFGGGVYVADGSSLVLQNGSSVDSHTAPSATTGRGAGIYATAATVTLDNSQVVSNTAGTNGGGIRLYNDCELNILNGSEVSNNVAENEDGGAIAAYGENDINISDSVFQDNQARTDGGAIHINGGTLDFTGWWDLRWNHAVGNGGGVAVTGTGDADFAVTSGSASSFLAVNTANGNGGGLYLGSNETADLHAVDGYLLRLNTNHAVLNGGAVYSDGSGIVFVLGEVEVTSNHADDNGGAFYIDNGSILQLIEILSEHPEILVNYADNGGGVYAAGGSVVACLGSVFGGSSSGNRADLNHGGAVYLDSSGLQSVNCTYRNNQAKTHGGAIAAYSGSVIIDSDFDYCDPSLGPCSNFYGNQADSDSNNSGNGGVLYNNDGHFSVDHSVLHDNTAYLGGGIYQVGTATTGEVKNSLLYRNVTSGAGGSAIRIFQGDIEVRQTTLVNNTGAPAFSSESTGTVEVFNSIAWDNAGGFDGTAFSNYGCNIDQEGNVGSVLDPLFVDAAGDDYHLALGSPAIDACPLGLLVDLDGILRPINGLYDMGAFEYLYHIFLPLVLK